MHSRPLAFRVASVWLILAGITLLFPVLADRVFALNLTNWGLASEYGGVLLITGVMYWVFARDDERYAPLTGLVVLGMLLNAAVNAYWWAVGHYALQTAIFNIVINTALAAWLWTLRPRAVPSIPAHPR
ncbi:hypothetical protein [Deinococcus apachensis]|uniref:hypothetical protein n=1 Tax=Deinococcus apachensis TaxID=309886 RepID=UPI00035D0FDA|nr:hypothetical protein [Deinococcus apachensis]